MEPVILGYVAGSLTTLCFVPQALKVIRENNISGVSLPMYILFSIGVTFWLAYGLMISNPPIILFNILTLALSLTILYKLIRLKN